MAGPHSVILVTFKSDYRSKMRLPTVMTACALVAAAVSAAVSAGDCPSTKLEYWWAQQRLNGYYDTCDGSLWPDFQPHNVSALTPLQIAMLSNCGNKPCLDTLRVLVPMVPDCDAPIGSMKHMWEKQLKMCERFATGGMSKAEIEELFKEFAGKGSSSATTVPVAAYSIALVAAAAAAVL